MESPTRRSSIRRVVLVGAIYFAIGAVFSTFSAPTVLGNVIVAWRVTAWLISAGVFAWQIWGDRVKFRRTKLATALNAACAAAIGAFALGARVALHSAHPSMLALLLWPAVTAVPAFVVALIVAAVFVPSSAARAAE